VKPFNIFGSRAAPAKNKRSRIALEFTYQSIPYRYAESDIEIMKMHLVREKILKNKRSYFSGKLVFQGKCDE
jgi:hypothetical protein